jgi:hypothetical protein
VRRLVHGIRGRRTFYCPVCQKAGRPILPPTHSAKGRLQTKRLIK